MSLVEWLIVGSGPSGCAAAAALIEAGHRPVMLDGGNISRPTSSAGGGINRREPGRKAWFGSNAAYAQSSPPRLTYSQGVLARASYGVGGFSRVWGATAELQTWDTWPADCRPAPEDIDLLWSLVPRAVTAWGDEVLANLGRVPGAPSSEIAMRRVQARVRADQWTVQPSVVAIDTRPRAATRCRPCAQCLMGCPRDSIWFSGNAIQEWVAQGVMEYRSGAVVESFSEGATSVGLRIRTPHGAVDTVRASRVLVAAGALSSAGLAIASGYRDSVRIKDTATAFGGIVSPRGARSGEEYWHGLSQWWISDTAKSLMAQIYAPSLSHAEQLAARVPHQFAGRGILDAAALHVHPVIAYLAECESDTLLVARSNDGVRVDVEGRGADIAMRRRLAPLASLFRRSGLFMPMRAVEVTPPGTGYHMGASFPHGPETDRLGRLHGMQRVHFVDSSVLPTIAVGSITPTVMANAMRIARQTAESAS